MKKIAIINDIHGNLLLFNKVLNSLEKNEITDFIFCGDMITDGFENNAVLNKIKSLSNNVIIGNREESLIKYDGYSWLASEKYKNMQYTYNKLTKENFNYIKNLPTYKIITIANKKICFSHGSPYNIRYKVNATCLELFDKLITDFNCDIYLFAHTHIPFYKEYKGKIFLNAGAINCPSHGKPESTYGILTINNTEIKYEQQKLKYDMEELTRYYLRSDYYLYCPEWSKIILNSLQQGIGYLLIFNENYNNKLTYKENFKQFIIKNNLNFYYSKFDTFIYIYS
jgi:putative phosphoesterase